MLLLAFVTMLLMCEFQVRSADNVTPNTFASDTRSISQSSNISGGNDSITRGSLPKHTIISLVLPVDLHIISLGPWFHNNGGLLENGVRVGPNYLIHCAIINIFLHRA
jgi:hypothetical protein